MELVIDTETTGLTALSFVTERNYRKWPRLVQVAWAIYSDGALMESRSALIRPKGFVIPLAVEGIHGISQARAIEEGKDLRSELAALVAAVRRASIVVAHNIRFDLGVLNAEAIRLGAQRLQPRCLGCTAVMGKGYLQKGRKPGSVSFPRLSDLYQELFASEHAPCHEALSDVQACARVYFQLKSLGY